MRRWLCHACVMQYPGSAEPPSSCPVCEDERQYVPAEGQQWTTLDELRAEHRADVREVEEGLIGIGMDPPFAIGQRALHLRGAGVNVLWDCIPLLTEAIVERVEVLGGIDVIAISHPHYYSTMVEWADRFDAQIMVHAADREWILRPSPRIELWEGGTHELEPGVTLVRCGGHFEGGQVLHWAAGAEGRGALLSGDVAMAVPDRRFVRFMRSYPNLIPLPAREVLGIADALDPFAFERIYGSWWDRVIPEDGKAAVRRSAERYVRAIRSE
jgi:glyoxylase-like metal-dependent hydrolase (beta-lactamase superfamily II)